MHPSIQPDGTHPPERLPHWMMSPLNALLHLLNRRTILILTLLFCAGVAAALWNMSQLSSSLIYSQAEQNAMLYAQAIKYARTLYSSEAVDRIKPIPGVTITDDYTTIPGAIPVPVTFLIEMGDHLSKMNPGMSVRLYSDLPFRKRQAEGGPRDDFEREALQFLRQHPHETFVRVEQFQGHPALRYAIADILQPSCIGCHNIHPDNPRKDWQVGDVRGVLEVTRPLDPFIQQTHVGLRGTFMMLTGLSVLGLSGIALVIHRLRQTSKELELRVIERTAQLREMNQQLSNEKEKSERLLLNILPEPIAEKLKEGQSSIADGFASATILFADIVNFTQLSERIPPNELVRLLNEIFSSFDCLTEQFGLEKIKTIGDAYMVASGLPTPRADHAQAIAEMAIAMRKALAQFNTRHRQNCNLRIGINTGPVVAGVIGTKKFIYDLWGDTVNLASRMESHGIPGEIQVTPSTYECLCNDYILKPRGPIEIKGKGQMITYLLVGKKP